MWNDLNMTQRNELIKLYLNNGISSLDKMKEHYNSFADGGHLYQDGGPDEPPQDQTITVSNPLFTTKGTLSQENADWDLGNQYTFKDTMRGIGLAGDYFSSEGFRNRANIANEKYGYLYNIEKPLRRTIPQQAAFIRDDNNANAAFKFGLNNSLNPIFVGAHETGHHNPVFNNYTFGMTTEEKAELSNPESTLYSPLYRNDYRNIPEDWRNILRNENPINDHDAELSEAYSDLVGLRALLKAYGIFDSTDPNAKFTQEMLDAFRKKLGNKGNRFLDYHSDENVIKAINEIAQNNTTEDTIHYAALGGHLYQAGGPIKKESNYSVGRVLDGIYRAVNHEEFMGEPSHKYQFIKPEYVGLSEEELDSLVGQADERGHRLDIVKAEAHPSHYSRGTWNGNDFELTDKGLAEVNHTYFGLNDGGQDPQARLTYKGSTVLPEITITPDGAYIYNTYDNIKLHLKQQGGYLGKVTPLGQWQYPHQVTTIPSNNITMKGVDYPVLGISDTGDTKYMLPNMDYLFDGSYITEYPLHKH